MTAPSFCIECGSPLPPGAKFCPQCGTRVEPGAGRAPAAGDEVLPSVPAVPEVPPELRARYESARAALRGDRREVAVLFADVQGYTALAETMDPEAVGILMQGLLREMAEAVHRWGGYVDKYLGDAVMALFGAPVAHEDDAARAVGAALAMQESVERRNAGGEQTLAVRVGLNVGEVVAGHVGSDSRSQYTVMGDTVNVASRLEHAAEPGTVLVTERVWRRVSDRFEGEEVPALDLKGKAEPVRAFRVTGRRADSDRDASGRTPFVGRSRERSEVIAWLKSVPAGGLPPLAVIAEAGAGKSRLVAEALAHTSAPRAVQLGFSPVRPPGTMAPAVELFHALTGSPGRARAMLGDEYEAHESGILDLAEDVDPGSGVPQSGVDPKAARQNRWLAVAALLRASARDSPIVLVVEDLHWAEEADAELVDFLAGAAEGIPAGLLLTGRPPLDALPEAARVVTLEPLGETEARKVLDALAVELPAETRRDLARRGQGNPLFLEELARAAREGGEIPGTLQGMIRSRIDRVGADSQRLLLMAAVLGPRFPETLLARMYALEEDSAPFGAAVAELEDSGFLEPARHGERRFRHALVEEVAYRGILHGVRRVLHESAARIGAETFDRPESEPAFFARHWWEADRPGEAAPWLWAAGRAAWDAFDLSVAERWLDRAVEALERRPGAIPREEVARLQEVAGTVAFHRGQTDAVEERAAALEELGDEADEGGWVARAMDLMGRAAWMRGRLEEARDAFETGLDRLPEDDGPVAADLHNDVGVVFYYRGDAARSRAHHERALEIRESIADSVGMAKSLTNLGNLWVDLGDDLDRAEAHYTRARLLAEEAGDRGLRCTATMNMGRVALERGDCERAIERLVEAETTAEEIGWPYLRLLALLNRAQALTHLGRLAEALSLYEILRREGDAVFEAVGRFNVRSYPFEAWLRCLEDDRAAAALEEARALAEELGLDEVEDDVRLMEGRLAVARGDWEAAAESFERAEAAAERHEHESQSLLARGHRARAAARAGLEAPAEPPRHAGARRALAALLDYLAADARAAREPSPRAAEALLAAGERAEELSDPGLVRAACERAAEILEAAGETTAAERAFDRAARAMGTLADGLPDAIREAFLAHPRNARLGGRPEA